MDLATIENKKSNNKGIKYIKIVANNKFDGDIATTTESPSFSCKVLLIFNELLGLKLKIDEILPQPDLEEQLPRARINFYSILRSTILTYRREKQ